MLNEGADPLDTTIADLYVSDCVPQAYRKAITHSYTVIDVLKFLWGLKWNNLTCNWIATLEPTYIQATKNHNILPSTDRAVVVYLDNYSESNYISKIMQFVRVDTFAVKNAADLIERTNTLKKEED